MAAPKATAPAASSTAAYGSTIYSVVEDLNTDAADLFALMENDGALEELSPRLGQLRDRADAIQTVVLQHIESINTYL